jgi:hypothetical protein
VHLRTLWTSTVALGLIALAMLAVGCGGDDDGATPTPTRTATASVTASRTPTQAPTSTAPPTTTATATATSEPPATESPDDLTGVPAVDRIITDVLEGDLDAIQSAVELRSLACGPQAGSGSPPACPDGQPDGTMVSVLPVATCEGEWRPESAIRTSFTPLTNGNPELHAVYGMPSQFQQLMPDGQYVAVFERDAPGQGRLGTGVVIGANRIVGLWFGCGATAEQIVPAGTSTILPPRG